jgi:hypothetical protein
MAKDAMITGRISKELKEQAKEQNVSLSDAIEQALSTKSKDTANTTLILRVEKYGISLMANNWVVGRVSEGNENPVEGARKEIFDSSTQSYHPTLHQALVKLSKRLFEDKVKVACKDKPLELNELANIIKEHHAFFVDMVKGM